MRLFYGSATERIARYLKEAHKLRRIAAAFSMRHARAGALESAIECEQEAAALQNESAARTHWRH